ncbi:MAG: OmpA family protein [Saprospiraceae bacterium]
MAIILPCLLFMTGCSYTKKIKNGETAYELQQYSVAIRLFSEEYKEYSNSIHKARIAFLLGKSYEKTLDYPSALEWYKTAENAGFGPEAKKQAALQLKMMERYSESMIVLKELQQLPEYKVMADREFLICKEAERWKSDPEPYQIEKPLETMGYSHYSPTIYRDKYLVVSSDRPEANGKSIYAWTDQKYSDLFIFTKTGVLVSPFDPLINSKHNEGSVCFTKSYNTVYFTRCQRELPENDDCKIMVSQFFEGAWTEPQTLNFIKEKVQYGHPTLLENDSVLVFSSDLSNPGGTFDLFYSELMENGIWSDPFPMPKSINSDGNEKFPTADNDTLYFSSDYLPGMGGYDIFKTYLKSDKSWAIPVNLKYPINSGADDFSLIVDKEFMPDENRLSKGYFSSSRSLKGHDEIYSYTQIYKKVDKKDVPKAAEIDYFIAGNTFSEAFENDDPNGQKLEPVILADCHLQLYNDNGILVDETKSNQKGIFLFKVEANQNYTIKGQKINFLAALTEANTFQLFPKLSETVATRQVDLILAKIFLDKELILNNIYYEFDQWNLTKEAYPTLEVLANMMITNPSIKIQLNSHTDCRGDDEYNLELSQKRAQSVVQFLINKGIDPLRLIAVGFGKTKPYLDCICTQCSEEEHQKNRRTSFTILSVVR